MEGFHSDQYWFWMKRRQIQAQTESWEEKAFAEDAARSILNGSIWPPRFYSCNFCKREFRSAQALGGHMNIHRRDRARLKQNLSPQSNNDLINSSSLGNHCFPAKRRSISPSRMISTSTLSSLYSSSIIWGQKKIGCNNAREDKFKDCVETSLSLGVFGPKSSTVLPCEEKGIICKRLKTDNTSYIPSLFIKPCSKDHQRFLTFQQPSENVLGVGVNHGMEDLDLELRLGKQQKIIN